MTISLSAQLHWTGTGRAYLHVYQSSYLDDAFREDMRSVGSPATWNPKQSRWEYPLTPAGISTLHGIIERYQIPISWSDDLQEYAEQQKQLDTYENSVRLAIEKMRRDNEDLPFYPTNTDNNTKPPLYHQRLSYHWGTRVSGLLLAHEPGLGKTRSAVDISAGWYRESIISSMTQHWVQPEYVWVKKKTRKVNKKDEYKEIPAHWKESQPGRWAITGGILVVCPKDVMYAWQREFERWQYMTSVMLSGSSRAVKFKRSGMIAHAHIVNYGSLHVAIRNQYDAIIVDESHNCANSSQQTENVLSLCLRAKRRLLLTGTPVSNNLESVFNQMLICDGGRSLGPSRQAFIDKYFERVTVGPGIPKNTPKENAVSEVAKAMSRSAFFLKKSEALDLPAKLDTPLHLEMLPDQQRYYESIKQEAIAYIQDAQVTTEQAVSKMMKLMQICQGIVRSDDKSWRTFNNAKMESLIDKLKGELTGRKVVVWCRFTYEIDVLCQRLYEEGIWAVRFDGSVKAQGVRKRVLDAWNHDPRYTVFVGQLSMGVGIELQAHECEVPCYDCCYLGLDYSYVNWIQSQDRIHRIGQRFNCNYTYFLTENGIDRSIYQALMSKRDTSNTVHKTGKDFFLSLIKDDTPNLAAIDMVAA